MKRTRIVADPALFPAEVRRLLADAAVYDSSCSPEARVYYIDCDAQIIWHIESNATVVDTQLSSGKFPVLLPGSNSVTGSGWSSITVTKRERFL